MITPYPVHSQVTTAARMLVEVWQRWLTQLTNQVNTTANYVRQGTGDPEGVVLASQGALWQRQDGGAGTTIYYKSSGGVISPSNPGTDTGWLPLT